MKFIAEPSVDTWYRITYNNRHESLRDYPFSNDTENDEPISVQMMARSGRVRLITRHGEWRRHY